MSDVINFKKGFILVNTVDDSVTSHSISAIARQIADEFVANVRVSAKTVDSGSNQPLKFGW